MGLRALFVFAGCVLVAVVVGYLLATPQAFTSYVPIALGISLMLFPLVMRWHHPLTIIAWNSTLIVFFLPGQPTLGTALACLSLGLSFLDRTMGRIQFLRAKETTWPLIVIGVVVLVTAFLTGGVGGRAFGSEMWGAKRYLGVIGAIIGYFAITARPIPPDRVRLLAGAFFLGGATAVGSDLALLAGPSFYFLFTLFSPDIALLQVASRENLMRYTGVAWFSLSLFFFMLMHYGIRGIMDLTRPWRVVALLGLVVTGMLGGYRSSVVMMGIIFAIQFFMEGLFRTRFFPMLLLALVALGALSVPFVDKLPLSIQRSLSFLPLDIDPSARSDAEGTIEWRIAIWKLVTPDVPNYLLLGKGYAFNSTDYHLSQEAVRRGIASGFEVTLISGNYHSGILTLIIPFGIAGVLGFVAFCWGGVRTLYRNFRHGDPRFQNINRFLFVYFVGRLIFYWIFYGQFDLDLYVFTGTVALSIAINGGVARPPAKEVAQSDRSAESERDVALAAVSP